MLRFNREKIQELFIAAADLPARERNDFLDGACAGKPDLRRAVDTLLSADRKGIDGIDQSVQREAQALLKSSRAEDVRIGAYRVTGEIGRGGMGTVYVAVRDDDQYQKKVAIKVVRRGMDTQDIIERFREERQILANLDHPGVARLLDGGTTTDGLPFFVMECIEGQALDVYCREHDLNVRERCTLFLKMCDAVSYAHRNLVVHRDLKPGNILVTADGSPKLLDFGVAKLLDGRGAGTHTVTAASLRPFTPEYASPEQVLGDPITTAADVYSLGAVLYELLSGKRAQPLTNFSPREVERVVCTIDPMKVSEATPELRGELEGDLDSIVAMAMRKEPAERYSSVEQFAADVKAYLQGWPVIARQGNFAYRARKYLARNRTAIAAGFLIATALLGGASAATMQARRAEFERRHAMESQARAETSQIEAERQAGEAQIQRANAVAQRKQAEAEGAIAETQRRLADRRFDQVHQMASKFLLDFHDAIAGLPGSTPARKMAVETGLHYYDSLVGEAQGNRELLEEIARGYDRLGDVQGNPYAANLGDLDGALASYRKALAIREGIKDFSPGFLHDRVLGSVKTAQVLIPSGDLKGAEETLTRAIALAQQSPAAKDYSVRLALANAYGIYGDVQVQTGLFEQASAAYGELLALWNGLARDARDPRAERIGVSLAHTKLGDVLQNLQRGSESLSHLRIALEMDKHLSVEMPNSIPRLRKVYIDYVLLSRLFQSNAGQTLAEAGEANAVAQNGADIADRMLAVDPNNNLALTDVMMAQSTLGDLLRHQHEIQAALAPYRKSLEAAQKQGANGPESFQHDSMLMMAYHRLGRALSEAGQQQEALADFRKADDFLMDAEKARPGPHYGEYRADLLGAKADVFVRQKDWKTAIAMYTEAIAIIADLAKQYPDNGRYVEGQPELYFRLADCYASAERLGDARLALRTGLDRMQQVAALRPLSTDEEEERQAGTKKLADWK